MTDKVSQMMTTRQVAEALGVSPVSVRQYAIDGHLSSFTTKGKSGRAQRRYFDPEEVEAFRRGGALAAQAFRERKKLKPRRGGKAVA